MPLLRNTSLNRGDLTATVAAGAGTTVISAGPGMLRKIVVTTAGTAGTDTLIFDNATTASGTLIGRIPGTIPVGTTMYFSQINNIGEPGLDFGNGCTVLQIALGPAFTATYQ